MIIEKFDTQFARLHDEDIYIQRAESGRKGYTCIGCKRPMEAVRQKKNPDHKSFFRHIIPPELKDSFNCSFDAKKYLERIVEQIIIKRGFIVLPEVIKFPPSGFTANAILLQESMELRPARIKEQQTFSLNTNYSLEVETDTEVTLKSSSIRPDLTFFDENDKPILFIEIVFTHPIDENKKGKLIHYGVDTIQIILPQTDKETLAELVETGNNTKWVYNNEEFTTDYFSVAGKTGRSLQTVDEEQRKLYEEAFTCRRTRIRELIQSIERCLESDQFNRSKDHLKREITRIGELTKTAKSGLAEMERKQEEGIYPEFGQNEKELRDSETGEQASSAELKCRYFDLEERYFRKAEELNEEEEPIRKRERDIFGAENPGENLPKRISAISSDIERISKKRELENKEDKISSEERRIDEQLAEFDRIEKRLEF